ncbi:hypothetical protein [Streptosporangium sp. 'caverna']|nr:hypothetical protein [Streptosporangium sp. 'caverna']
MPSPRRWWHTAATSPMTPGIGGAKAPALDRLSHVDQTYLRPATYR